MMRKFVAAILLSALSAGAMALGLGNIQLNSGLNQPFDARIELLSPTASELDSLVVRLADSEAFGRAGIDRAFVLTTLRFEVQQNPSGDDYIHVSSREPMREPFLNFLVEANWSNGKLFREYTVLLDPPLYDPAAGRQLINTGSEGSISQPATVQPAEAAGIPQDFSTGQTGSTFTGNEVGPISSSETLWSVASRVRPDTSVSVNQMMLALLRANPEAFIGNNINGLKQGQILRVPELAEINSTSYQAAIEEVRSQNAMWEDIRGNIAANTATRPVATTSIETASQTPLTGPAAGVSELRLVAAGEQSSDTGQTGAAASTGTTDASLELMNEQMQSLTSENAELRDRVTESEQIIEDLRRLIELKDDELAAMQQQIGSAPADSTTIETPVDQAEASEEVTLTTEEAAGEPIIDTVAEESPVETPEDSAAEIVEEEPVAEEEPIEEVVTAEAGPAPMIEVDSTSAPGLVDTVLDILFSNILLIGGGLLVIVLAVLGAGFVRKRREAASQVEQALPVAFPDFETPPAEVDAPDGPQIDIDIDKAGAESAEAHTAEPTLAPVARQAAADEVAPAAPGTAEEDPLAEVNVFLAYEHFDSAEEFVRDAISRQPDNLDFHSKLLEVFYSAGDKTKYEEEARVLYDLTGGAGPHWDMATIMWQEMSPNRSLFAEPAEGEEDVKADITTGRGIVDLTADDNAAEEDEASLDFDLGAMEAESAPSKQTGSDDMLDITAGSDDGILDVTASESNQADEEDILDVTAAVGLDAIQQAEDDSLSLDLPATDEQDILDISASGTDSLLDVTAHADLDAEQDEDLLDVTMTGSGTGELPDSGQQGESGKSDDNLLDFDIGGVTGEVSADDLSVSGGLAIDGDGGLDMDFGSDTGNLDADLGLSLDPDTDSGDGGIELDFSTASDTSADDGSLELSLDQDTGSGDGGLELDFADTDNSGSDTGLSLDLGSEEETASTIDMDSTVKIPKHAEISLEDISDDEDDEGDHTVFVPRTRDEGEQSSDDENATKLDLAKAYVELGDEDNAKSILEEVIAGGNPAQRRQAQELMAQIG